MKKLIFLLSVILLFGCTNDVSEQPELKIISITSSLATTENNPEKSLFEFEITLENTSEDKLKITTVEPYFVQNIADIMEDKDLLAEVNRDFSPNDTLEIANYIFVKTVEKEALNLSQNDFIFGVMVTFKNGEELFIQK